MPPRLMPKAMAKASDVVRTQAMSARVRLFLAALTSRESVTTLM